MIITPKRGIDNMLFGMKQKDIIETIGMPNKKFEDEDQNIVLIYNNLKLMLTFYAEEDFRLGYIVCGNTDAKLFEKVIIGSSVNDIPKNIISIKNWELEDFDTFVHYFDENHWLILVSEFDVISKIEIGAIIENDEFIWAF